MKSIIIAAAVAVICTLAFADESSPVENTSAAPSVVADSPYQTIASAPKIEPARYFIVSNTTDKVAVDDLKLEPCPCGVADCPCAKQVAELKYRLCADQRAKKAAFERAKARREELKKRRQASSTSNDAANDAATGKTNLHGIEYIREKRRERKATK